MVRESFAKVTFFFFSRKTATERLRERRAKVSRKRTLFLRRMAVLFRKNVDQSSNIYLLVDLGNPTMRDGTWLVLQVTRDGYPKAHLPKRLSWCMKASQKKTIRKRSIERLGQTERGPQPKSQHSEHMGLVNSRREQSNRKKKLPADGDEVDRNTFQKLEDLSAKEFM